MKSGESEESGADPSEPSGWSFRITERSAGSYVAVGRARTGHEAVCEGTDPSGVMAACVAAAHRVQRELERHLHRKLLVALHLSVPERQVIQGKARLSVLTEVLEQALRTEGWFPAPPRPDDALGPGAAIELRGRDLWVHEQQEMGVMRLGPVRSFRVPSLAAALRAYVDALGGGSTVDGVPIDWNA